MRVSNLALSSNSNFSSINESDSQSKADVALFDDSDEAEWLSLEIGCEGSRRY
jgi:hypothetical protein